MPTLQASPWTRQQPSACPLIGSWRLARVELRPRSARSAQRLFAGVTGQLDYWPDGRMALELADDGWRRACRGTYLSFLDAFSASNDVVVHRIESASDPALIGLEEERRVQLRGDTLTWPGAPVWIDGERWTPHLLWERIAR